MTNLYEVSASRLGRSIGFHQEETEYSGTYYALGDTANEARKALETYLGKGWESSQDARELRELNNLSLEQRLVLLAELRREIIGKDGKKVMFETKLVPKL